MKKLLKQIASKVDVATYQRFISHSLQNRQFKQLSTVPCFDTRAQFYADLSNRHLKPDTEMTYLEFGVWEGNSIRYFSQTNENPQSSFYGMDSFEGLPEKWAEFDKGTFSTGGNVPDIADTRVSFVKGWFQNTWDELKSQLDSGRSISNLVVNYDADLYSSTLFALTKVDILKCDYIAIFDEFTGDESRALHDYMQAYGVSVEFYSKTLWNGYPLQVACKITHNRAA